MKVQFDANGKLYTDVVPTVTVRTTLQTTTQLIQGDIHVRVGERLKDELDQPAAFLAVTHAEVVGPNGQVLFRAPFLAVSWAQVVWVMPTAEENEGQSS